MQWSHVVVRNLGLRRIIARKKSLVVPTGLLAPYRSSKTFLSVRHAAATPRGVGRGFTEIPNQMEWHSSTQRLDSMTIRSSNTAMYLAN